MMTSALTQPASNALSRPDGATDGVADGATDEPGEDMAYQVAVDELLTRHGRERYELQLTHISERLRLADQHGDATVARICRTALLMLTHDFRASGATPLFANPGDLGAPQPNDNKE